MLSAGACGRINHTTNRMPNFGGINAAFFELPTWKRGGASTPAVHACHRSGTITSSRLVLALRRSEVNGPAASGLAGLCDLRTLNRLAFWPDGQPSQGSLNSTPQRVRFLARAIELLDDSEYPAVLGDIGTHNRYPARLATRRQGGDNGSGVYCPAVNSALRTPYRRLRF